MATRKDQGGATAPSNVTRLPTAAPRKVQQNHNRASHAARTALQEQQGRRFEHIGPQRREALKKAAILREVEQTPALRIAAALFKALDADTQLRVLAELAPSAARGSGPAVQAIAVLHADTRATVGEQLDLDWAFRRLGGEA